MHVVLRLQNHGCKNHPYWWIVVAPRKRNIKGRFIEHVGYWIPHERRVLQRSVILNKPRIKYWLAMGAQTTPRVQHILSWIDYLPAPPMKYGSKTVYEKPKKPLDHSLFRPYNPINSAFERYHLGRIIEQENKNTLRRQILYEQGVLKELPPSSSELESQWDRLRAELHQIERDAKHVDPHQRQVIFGRMNELAAAWDKEKKLQQVVKAEPTSDSNLKQQLVYEQLLQDQEKQMQEKLKWLQEYQPLTDQELYEYLNTYNAGYENKTQEQMEIVKRYALDTAQGVTKALVDDFIRLEFDVVEPMDDVHHGGPRKSVIKEVEFIPSSKPIHPLPDFEDYNPDEYTDILKEREQLIKNKAFSIPNVDLEGEFTEYPAESEFRQGMRSASKGRSTQPRGLIPVSNKRKRIKELYRGNKK